MDNRIKALLFEKQDESGDAVIEKEVMQDQGIHGRHQLQGKRLDELQFASVLKRLEAHESKFRQGKR